MKIERKTVQFYTENHSRIKINWTFSDFAVKGKETRILNTLVRKSLDASHCTFGCISTFYEDNTIWKKWIICGRSTQNWVLDDVCAFEVQGSTKEFYLTCPQSIPGNLHNFLSKSGNILVQQHTSKFYPRPSHDFSLSQHEDSGS